LFFLCKIFPHNKPASVLSPCREVEAFTKAYLTSVADPYHICPDPDPACLFDADPDPAPSFQIKAQNLEEMLK
jgi:hypothetical protein